MQGRRRSRRKRRLSRTLNHVEKSSNSCSQLLGPRGSLSWATFSLKSTELHLAACRACLCGLFQQPPVFVPIKAPLRRAIGTEGSKVPADCMHARADLNPSPRMWACTILVSVPWRPRLGFAAVETLGPYESVYCATREAGWIAVEVRLKNWVRPGGDAAGLGEGGSTSHEHRQPQPHFQDLAAAGEWQHDLASEKVICHRRRGLANCHR